MTSPAIYRPGLMVACFTCGGDGRAAGDICPVCLGARMINFDGSDAAIDRIIALSSPAPVMGRAPAAGEAARLALRIVDGGRT